jgi:hypothetical protein
MREVCGGASGRGLQPGHAVHIVRCGALLGCGSHIVYTVCCGDERCRQQCIDAVCALRSRHIFICWSIGLTRVLSVCCWNI